VKYAAHRLNLCANELRLPLVPIAKATEEAVDFALSHAGLI
jgi:4-hydroxy-tetrahydrodipicolinate synthase